MCRKCADSYEEFLLLCIKAFELDQFKNQVVTFVIFYEIAEIQGHVWPKVNFALFFKFQELKLEPSKQNLMHTFIYICCNFKLFQSFVSAQKTISVSWCGLGMVVFLKRIKMQSKWWQHFKLLVKFTDSNKFMKLFFYWY